MERAGKLALAKRASVVAARTNIRRYPLNPVGLAERLGVKVIPYRRFCELAGTRLEALLELSPDGVCCYKDSVPMVIYNAEVQSKGRRRWTLLHELSHLMLGHITPEDGLGERRLSEDCRRWQEAEADGFAAALIAPLGIAHLCNIQSAGEMAGVFGLSAESAGYFYEDLQRLRTNGQINRLLFPESVSLCLPFISDRLVAQYRQKIGMLRAEPCLDIVYDGE